MAMVAPSNTSALANGTPDASRPTMNGHAHADSTMDLATSTLNTPIDSPSILPAQDPIQTVTYKPAEKFHRIDTLHMKRKLFEALGSGESGESEQARQYWEYLGQFVRGKLRREEFVELLAGVLDTSLKVTLHNHLLTAVLHNSVCTLPIASTPTLPVTQTVPQPTTTDSTNPNDPQNSNTTTDPTSTFNNQPLLPPRELDISEVPDVLPRRTRVREWLGGLNRAERDRLKRLGGASMYDDRNKTFGEMQRGYQGRGRFRQNSKPLRTNVTASLHPLAQSTGYVPSQRQLKERLVDLAKLNGMTEGIAEGMDDLVGAALDTHLDSLFCGAIDVKLRPRSLDDRIPADETTTDPTSDIMQVDMDETTTRKSLPTTSASNQPAPHPSSPRAAGLAILKQDSTYELAPTDPIHLEIQDFHSLFTLAPQVHPHLGSAVWQLRNGVVLREEQLEEEAKSMEGMWKTALLGEVEMDRSFEDVYNKVGSLSTGRLRTNGNAEAGPGPSSSNRYGMDSSSATTTSSTDHPSRLKLGLQPRETPSLSRPPTPVVSHAGSSLLNGAGSSGPGGETRHAGSNPLKRSLDDLDRFAGAGSGILSLPGPGGIIPRAGRSLLSGGLGPGGPSGRGINPSSSSSSNGGLGLALGLGYGPGTRRELIQRELEARKLYKIVDGRGPMLLNTTIPPITANQVGVAPLTAVGVAAGVMSMPPGAPGVGTAGPGAGPMPGQPPTPMANLDLKNDQGGPPIMLPPPLPPHGPNHWPYVDPASIFKDILG